MARSRVDNTSKGSSRCPRDRGVEEKVTDRVEQPVPIWQPGGPQGEHVCLVLEFMP